MKFVKGLKEENYESQQVGVDLYFIVRKYLQKEHYNNNLTEKITGMILEQGVSRVRYLIEGDHEELFGLVKNALEMVGAQKIETDLNWEDTRQMLGDFIYPLAKRYLEKIKEDPNLAGKITGMLLDLELDALNRLVQDESLLAAQFKDALDVLQRAHRVI